MMPQKLKVCAGSCIESSVTLSNLKCCYCVLLKSVMLHLSIFHKHTSALSILSCLNITAIMPFHVQCYCTLTPVVKYNCIMFLLNTQIYSNNKDISKCCSLHITANTTGCVNDLHRTNNRKQASTVNNTLYLLDCYSIIFQNHIDYCSLLFSRQDTLPPTTPG